MGPNYYSIKCIENYRTLISTCTYIDDLYDMENEEEIKYLNINYVK